MSFILAVTMRLSLPLCADDLLAEYPPVEALVDRVVFGHRHLGDDQCVGCNLSLVFTSRLFCPAEIRLVEDGSDIDTPLFGGNQRLDDIGIGEAVRLDQDFPLGSGELIDNHAGAILTGGEADANVQGVGRAGHREEGKKKGDEFVQHRIP